jgi:hypothetical protein
MKPKFLLIFFVIAVVNVDAQNKKLSFSAGSEYLIPTYSGISANGYGGGFTAGFFFSRHWGGTFNVSLDHFNGRVVDLFKNDTIQGFSIMPVMPGIKYFVSHKFYLSADVGMIIGIHNAGNHFAVSPGIGVLFPVNKKSKVDFSVKLLGVPRGYTFSENTFLNGGGYSYLAFKAAYVF